MKKIGLALLTMSLLSCGSMQKAQEIPIEKTKQVSISFDSSWAKIIKFFASKNVPIKTIEKDSGLIATDQMPFGTVTNKSLFNCGEYKLMGQAQEYQGKASFNVYAEKTDAKSTKITMNTTASYIFVNPVDATARNEMPCYSTGEIEKQLFDFVSR